MKRNKAQKIAAKLEDEEITQWNDSVNSKIKEADNQMVVLEEWLAKRKSEKQIQE